MQLVSLSCLDTILCRAQLKSTSQWADRLLNIIIYIIESRQWKLGERTRNLDKGLETSGTPPALPPPRSDTQLSDQPPLLEYSHSDVCTNEILRLTVSSLPLRPEWQDKRFANWQHGLNFVKLFPVLLHAMVTRQKSRDFIGNRNYMAYHRLYTQSLNFKSVLWNDTFISIKFNNKTWFPWITSNSMNFKRGYDNFMHNLVSTKYC